MTIESEVVITITTATLFFPATVRMQVNSWLYHSLHIPPSICFYVWGLEGSLSPTDLFFFHTADSHSLWTCLNKHTHTC